MNNNKNKCPEFSHSLKDKKFMHKLQFPELIKFQYIFYINFACIFKFLPPTVCFGMIFFWITIYDSDFLSNTVVHVIKTRTHTQRFSS